LKKFELKSIHENAVDSALEKAVWYRALNEPLEAESICRDVLEVDPENQHAIATLLLALTDHFAHGLGTRVRESRALAKSLKSDYEKEYYAGLISERRAKCQHRKGTPGCGHLAYEGLVEAMDHYEKAQKLSPEGNDDAVLRWNTCARMIDANPDIVPAPASQSEPVELE
jgi:tetratricopeptide (TPR) repeat protein